jgi:hypothetical protein
VLGLIFMFSATSLLFDGSGGVGTGLMFCASELIFDGTVVVGSCFHILCSLTHFRRYGGRRVNFPCFAFPDSFSTIEGVRSHFHLFRSRTHFRRYRGRQVSFSCFALPDSHSEVLIASGSVFMFCALELVFGGTVCVASLFHVLRSQTHFRRYRGCRVPFLYFSLPDMFSSVPRALSQVFMFIAPRLVFDGSDDVRSSFHVFRYRTRFQRYRGVGSSFHVLCSRTHLRR